MQTFIQLTINLESRFDHPDFEVYKQSERLLLKAANGDNYSEDLEAVLRFYNTDIDKDKLMTQLEILKEEFKKVKR